MPDGSLPSVHEITKLARKTLSRDESDTRPIPSKYLELLIEHLRVYPNETHFLMDWVDRGCAVTCLHCFKETLVNVEGQPPSFRPFWEHLESQEHKAALDNPAHEDTTQGTRDDPMDVDTFDFDFDLNFNADYVPPPPSNPVSRRRRITRNVLLSDGEIFEYSTEEEESEGRPQPNTSPNQNQFASSSHSQIPSNMGSVPFANNASWSNSYTTPQKRPHRGIRRHEFGDGEVFYLSTDDETVDERPPERREKQPRLGGALMKSQNRIVPLVKQPPVPQTPQLPPALVQQRQGQAPVISQWSSLSNWNNPRQSAGFAQSSSPTNPLSSSPFVQRTQAVHRPSLGGIQNPWAGPSTSGASTLQKYEVASMSQPYTPQNRISNGFPMSHPSMSSQRYPIQPPGVGSQNSNLAHVDKSPFGIGMPGGFPNMGIQTPQVFGHDEHMALPHGMPGLPVNQGPVFDSTQKFKDFFLTAMEDFQEAPKVMDAARKLGMENTSSFLPGLEVQLMPHQLIGVSWMIEQERKATKGGILADDMGLGKTLQCIATCVKNKPPSDVENRSTLVVAPAALLQQWKTEILQRTNSGLFQVHIHHGKEKLRSVAEVKNFDFVITTYQTLCLDFPKRKKIGPNGEELEVVSSDDSWDEDGQRIVRGPLAQTEWYRVILDEAQFIRNRKTRSSKCVARLKSTYRWTLTGTLVVNSLEDLYSPIRFLQMHPFDEWREFKHRILSVQKNPRLAGDRAQAMLKKCLLRRTKDTKLEGKPILQLPPRDVEIVQIDFSPDERQIYDRIEKREQQRMTKFLKAGTVLKNYMVILVMLLRLRQACNHPLLIASESADPDGFNTVLDEADARFQDKAASKDDVERAEKLIGSVFVKEVKAKLLEQAEARMKAESQGLTTEEDDTECPICYDSYINNCCITKCKHMFCADCLNDLFKSPPNNLQAQDAEYARAVQSGIRPCPVCRNNIHPDFIFRTKFFEPTEVELNAIRGIHPNASSSSGGITPVDVKGKGKAIDDLAELDDILADMRNETLEPSAKMTKMVDLLKQWNAEAPDDKIICYSQWTSMLDLVEQLLVKDGVDIARYDGKMSRLERDAAVAEFKKRSGPPIMLISLKCGGVGLNLVEANRVICLDLAWNAATENQAFDRVHRMGQQKSVHVKRLIVRNTVEDRILKLQASKQALSDAALGEGKAGKLKKLTVGELKALFGLSQ